MAGARREARSARRGPAAPPVFWGQRISGPSSHPIGQDRCPFRQLVIDRARQTGPGLPHDDRSRPMLLRGRNAMPENSGEKQKATQAQPKASLNRRRMLLGSTMLAAAPLAATSLLPV